MRPPNNPTPTGLHPVTPLGYGPRSDRFVPLTRRLVRYTNIFARDTTVPSKGEGALIGCLLLLKPVPQKVSATTQGRGGDTTAPRMSRRAQQSARGLGVTRRITCKVRRRRREDCLTNMALPITSYLATNKRRRPKNDACCWYFQWVYTYVIFKK